MDEFTVLENAVVLDMEALIGCELKSIRDIIKGEGDGTNENEHIVAAVCRLDDYLKDNFPFMKTCL